jgi:hypothetical protein
MNNVGQHTLTKRKKGMTLFSTHIWGTVMNSMFFSVNFFTHTKQSNLTTLTTNAQYYHNRTNTRTQLSNLFYRWIARNLDLLVHNADRYSSVTEEQRCFYQLSLARDRWCCIVSVISRVLKVSPRFIQDWLLLFRLSALFANHFLFIFVISVCLCCSWTTFHVLCYKGKVSIQTHLSTYITRI